MIKRFFTSPSKLIFALLAICAALYAAGIWYGTPYFFVGDEPSLIGGALKMLQTHNPFPVLAPQQFGILYYPVIIPYLLAIIFVPVLGIDYLVRGFHSLAAFQNALILDPSLLIIASRALSVAVGLALVWLTYQLGKKILRDQWAALLGAALLGFGFYQNQLSHFARHWIYTGFFAYLILYCASRIYEAREKKWYVLAAVATGAAFGVSYVGIIFGLFVLFAHFWPAENETFKSRFLAALKEKKIWIYFSITLALMLLVIAIYPQALWGVLHDGGAPTPLALHNSIASSYLFFVKVLVFMDPLIFLAGLAGVVWMFWKRYRIQYFLVPFVGLFILYPFLLFSIFHNEPRYVFLLIPGLALTGGWALAQLARWLALRAGKVVAALPLLLILVPLAIVCRYDYLLVQSDTRLMARDWMVQTFPPASVVLTNFPELRLPQTIDSVRAQKMLDASSLRQYDDVLLQSGQSQPGGYFVLNVHFLENNPDALYKIKSWYSVHYAAFQYPQSGTLSATDQSFIEKGSLLASFVPDMGDGQDDFTGNFVGNPLIFFQIRHFGPKVEIYGF